MADIDICNLALSFLGDAANVSSLSENSVQAQLCTRFYPIARNTLLEMHPWNFATQRAELSILDLSLPPWDYVYAHPSNAVRILAVIGPDVTDDQVSAGQYVPQPYTLEVAASGARVIYTDQEDATVRYTFTQTDTSKFSPLFTEALAWWLASYLAGPLLKGKAGRDATIMCRQAGNEVLSRAMTSDANQRHTPANHVVGWMVHR